MEVPFVKDEGLSKGKNNAVCKHGKRKEEYVVVWLIPIVTMM